MALFLTSDEHYGHKNIIGYCDRPFRDVEHMTADLIARHNAVVSEKDEVLHVGDFAFDEKLIPEVLKQLHGRHSLVVGNHDKCHPCHKQAEQAKRRYLLYGFESVVESLVIGKMLVHHMPYTGDERQRYHQYRPKDEGKVLLHGHIHTLWKASGRQINVGVDAWDYAPVSLAQVEAVAAALPEV